MMRSLFSGVSGLRTHQTRMDVIGNNIANVNTTAYKSMSINFSDLMYQTTQAATGPNATTGTAGTNPKQIGLGVQTAAISTKITEEGATQSTGNPFDLKISGDEFFVVSNGVDTFFTRDGSFYVDASGNLAMSSTGYNIMGWGVDPETMNIKKDTVQPLVIMGPDNETYPAEWTQKATASGIVDWFDDDQSEKAGGAMNLQIYDKLGYSYTVKFSLHNGSKPETVDQNYSYYVQVDDIVDAEGNSILTTDAKKNAVVFGNGTSSDRITVNETYGVNNGKVEGTTTGGTTTYPVYATFSYDTDGDATNGKETVRVMLKDANGSTANTALFNDNGTLNTNAVLQTETGGTINWQNGATAPTAAQIFQELYGTSISPTIITAATIDAKTGTLNVTEKNITNGSILEFSGKDGSLLRAGGGTDANTTTLDLSALGDDFTKIDIDFSKTVVSDNKGKSTIGIEKGDASGLQAGRALGTLQGVSIQTNGMIYASYSNGQQKLLGQIAVAEFANPSGLQKEGENLYSATQNSGDFDGIGIDITTNGDKMNTGVLEMSNVDLSSEFTDMITTQRGFQANSRIITVSDTLLEELVNLKR